MKTTFYFSDYELGMPLIYFLIILVVSNSSFSLRIATYNIWNQMFNWKLRSLKISKDIKFNKIEVVGLQEVRGGFHSTSNSQITELHSALPSRYKWSVYAPANNVTQIKDSIYTNYPSEGIGLISSLPLVRTFVKSLTPDKHDPDRNKRVILHAVVQDTSEKLVNILVLHLSYHRQQQCKNIAEVINYCTENRLNNVVIVGDLNTYKDYEDPIKFLTDSKTQLNKCREVLRDKVVPEFEPLLDAWAAANPSHPGLTFSNMPHPGMESRPDRVLVSQSMHIKSAFLKGDGKHYKQHYSNSILIERFLTVSRSSYLSYSGVEGYTCVHDCGPHGSCQCGICVKGSNGDGCLLPDCSVCDVKMYQNLLFYTALLVLVAFHCVCAIFAVLIIGSSSYGSAAYSILGFSCCLMSKDLFVSQLQSYRRKSKILKLCRFWPLFRLPPYLQLLISLIGFSLLFFRVKKVFAPALDITYRIMEEEFFPSDHLLLAVDIDT